MAMCTWVLPRRDMTVIGTSPDRDRCPRRVGLTRHFGPISVGQVRTETTGEAL